MQREHVADLQVGDFIQLPAGEWHKNSAAQAMYGEAQRTMRDHQGGDRPQFQVQSEPGAGFKARLERIR
jgi:hypothetical protein